MASLFSYKISRTGQFIISILLVVLVATIGFFLSGVTGYRVVAMVLLVAVSILAMFFDIVPVLVAAVLSALIWDFFLIPPRLTFQVKSTEDVLMLLMYFFVALINAVLTFKIRQMQKSIRLKEEKENAIRLYNTVLNSLSHELRTPIATILGAADGLAQTDITLSEQNKTELLAEITTASLRLNHQVENLLNISRLESGFIQPKKDWCDVSELVYAVVNRLEPNLSRHAVEVDLPEQLPLFKLDYGMVDQVLHNLVNNALQHTPSGSKIFIRASYKSHGLHLEVEDNGKGFPPGEISKAFDKFYRLPNSPTGGIGLGLSIVKGFVQAMEGTITLQNRARDGGALFIIQIPAEITNVTVNKNEE